MSFPERDFWPIFPQSILSVRKVFWGQYYNVTSLHHYPEIQKSRKLKTAVYNINTTSGGMKKFFAAALNENFDFSIVSFSIDRDCSFCAPKTEISSSRASLFWMLTIHIALDSGSEITDGNKTEHNRAQQPILSFLLIVSKIKGSTPSMIDSKMPKSFFCKVRLQFSDNPTWYKTYPRSVAILPECFRNCRKTALHRWLS